MLIDFRELLFGTRDLLSQQVELEMNTINNGVLSYDIVKKEPFELCLTKISQGKFHISASSFVTLRIPCDRCLTPVDTEIYFIIDETVDMAEVSESEECEEKDYIDGYNLDVDKLIFDEILLSMPGKILCKEDCKGLCLVCGANLNIAECGCDRSVLDPRMSVFKDILNDFKEV